MPPPANYFDGDHTTAYQHGPIIRWSDVETRAEQYAQTMRIKADQFSPLAIGTAGETGFYLYEETRPHLVGGEVVEWERLYTEIPDERTEYESYAHPYQFISGTDLGEIVVTVQSRIVHTFIQSDAPADEIEILRAYRLVKAGDVLFELGDDSNNTSEELLAQDSTYKRWKPNLNIYEQTARYVPVFDIDEV